MKSNLSFEINSTPDCVQLWLDKRLSFEPKGEYIAARNSLRERLRGLDVPAGQILSATYSAIGDAFCDVENVLFYNFGAAAFPKLSRKGLRFERILATPLLSPSGAAFDHQHRYFFVPSDCEFTSQTRPKCTFECLLPVLSSSTKPHHVWWHVTDAKVSLSENVSGPFELRIRLGVPTASNVANFLKPLLDGVISGLHSESNLDLETVRRLAEREGWNPDETKRRLLSPAAPILGPRRLLYVYRDFVKWNPADDLCTCCTILTHEAPEWSCSVEVSEATCRGNH
jgi:hypothetical protein